MSRWKKENRRPQRRKPRKLKRSERTAIAQFPAESIFHKIDYSTSSFVRQVGFQLSVISGANPAESDRALNSRRCPSCLECRALVASRCCPGLFSSLPLTSKASRVEFKLAS